MFHFIFGLPHSLTPRPGPVSFWLVSSYSNTAKRAINEYSWLMRRRLDSFSFGLLKPFLKASNKHHLILEPFGCWTTLNLLCAHVGARP